MNKICLEILTVILIFNFFNINLDAETNEIPMQGEMIVNEEGYHLKEVLFMPWGNAENEINIGKKGEYLYGPKFLRVDNFENIYFDNPNKKRVIKYTLNGELTHIEGIEYIAGIFNNGNILNGKGFVFNPQGQLQYKIRIPSIPEGIIKMIQDKDDNIFINPQNIGYLTLVVSDEKDEWGYKKSKFKEKWGGKHPKKSNGYPSKFLGRDYEVSSSTNNNNEIKFLGRKNKKVQKINKRISNKKLSKYKADNSFIIGEDNKGNIYFVEGLRTIDRYDSEGGFVAIKKYNENGILLLTIKIFENWSKIDMQLDNSFSVSNIGNIYQMYSKEDGLRIVRWGK